MYTKSTLPQKFSLLILALTLWSSTTAWAAGNSGLDYKCDSACVNNHNAPTVQAKSAVDSYSIYPLVHATPAPPPPPPLGGGGMAPDPIFSTVYAFKPFGSNPSTPKPAYGKTLLSGGYLIGMRGPENSSGYPLNMVYEFDTNASEISGEILALKPGGNPESVFDRLYACGLSEIRSDKIQMACQSALSVGSLAELRIGTGGGLVRPLDLFNNRFQSIYPSADLSNLPPAMTGCVASPTRHCERFARRMLPRGPMIYSDSLYWGVAFYSGSSSQSANLYYLDPDSGFIGTPEGWSPMSAGLDKPAMEGEMFDAGDGNLWGLSYGQIPEGTGDNFFIFILNKYTGLWRKINLTQPNLRTLGNSPHNADRLNAVLVDDGYGNLWGTSGTGESIFKVNRQTEDVSVVHVFSPADGLGGQVVPTLTDDGRGNFWGVTKTDYIRKSQSGGATRQKGTIFKINKVSGELKYMHFFSGGDDGYAPTTGLVNDGNGYMWGTTSKGAAHNNGAIYKIKIE